MLLMQHESVYLIPLFSTLKGGSSALVLGQALNFMCFGSAV